MIDSCRVITFIALAVLIDILVVAGYFFFFLRILLVGVCAGCEPEFVNASGEKTQGRRQLEKMRRRDWEMDRRDREMSRRD